MDTTPPNKGGMLRRVIHHFLEPHLFWIGDSTRYNRNVSSKTDYPEGERNRTMENSTYVDPPSFRLHWGHVTVVNRVFFILMQMKIAFARAAERANRTYQPTFLR